MEQPRMRQTMPEDRSGWHEIDAGPHLEVLFHPDRRLARREAPSQRFRGGGESAPQFFLAWRVGQLPWRSQLWPIVHRRGNLPLPNHSSL